MAAVEAGSSADKASADFGWRAGLRYDSPEAAAVRRDLASSGLPRLLDRLVVDPAAAPTTFAQVAAARFHKVGCACTVSQISGCRSADLPARARD